MENFNSQANFIRHPNISQYSAENTILVRKDFIFYMPSIGSTCTLSENQLVQLLQKAKDMPTVVSEL